MAIGSGLAGQYVVAPETTYGTFAAPAKAYEVSKADVKKNKNVVQGGGIAAGRIAQAGSRRIVTHESAAGTIEGIEVTNKGMGFWLDQILGGTGNPVQQGASTAYLLSRAIADNVGKSFSGQVGVPDTTGTVRPYTHKGTKVTAVTFTCERGGLLTMTVTVDGRIVSEVETLVAPSYVAGLRAFHFGQLTPKLGAVGAEAAVNGVTSVSVTIERTQDVERIYAGAGGLKAEPLMTDFVKVSGSIGADFLDKTVFADRFAADSSISMVLDWVGPLIAATYYEGFKIKLPMIFFDGDSPILDGPGLVSGTFPFTAQLDLTNPLVTIDYMSTDTTL